MEDGILFPLRTPVRWLRMAALQLLAGRSFWAEMELGPPWIMITIRGQIKIHQPHEPSYTLDILVLTVCL